MTEGIDLKSLVTTRKKMKLDSELVPLRHFSMTEAVAHWNLAPFARTYASI